MTLIEFQAITQAFLPGISLSFSYGGAVYRAELKDHPRIIELTLVYHSDGTPSWSLLVRGETTFYAHSLDGLFRAVLTRLGEVACRQRRLDDLSLDLRRSCPG